MDDGLDVVSVRIELEGGIVAGVIGAFARAAVVATAGVERGGVEGVDGGPVPCLEREVDRGTGPFARSTQSSSQAKWLGLSEVRSRPIASRTAR